MEIMTREEYVIAMAKTLLDTLRTLDTRVNRLTCDDEDAVRRNTESDILDWLELAGHDGQINAILNGDIYGAYEAYCEEHEEKDHIYDVDFSFTVSGKAQVHAKDEDEAEDYVNENLCIEPEVNFYEDDRQVGEIEVDDYNTEQSFDIDDTGDEWEE